MPGDGEDSIGLDQKPEGTGKPDRSPSAPRHRVGVAGRDSTPCMSGLEKTMPAALTAQVLSGLSLGLIGNASGRKASVNRGHRAEALSKRQVEARFAESSTRSVCRASGLVLVGKPYVGITSGSSAHDRKHYATSRY